MDIIGKILQAILGGERPRTWIDALIVVAICSTYALTQALRFIHHQRHQKAVMVASPEQLRALAPREGIKPPKATAALVMLVLACAGLPRARLELNNDRPYRSATVPLCFVRNNASSVQWFL